MLINIPSQQWVSSLCMWWLAISIISTDCLHPRLREPEYGHMRNGMRAASSRDSVWQEPGNYEEFLVRVACAQLIECFVMIRKLPGASCTSSTFPAMTRKMSQERPFPSVPSCRHKCGYYNSQNNEFYEYVLHKCKSSCLWRD